MKALLTMRPNLFRWIVVVNVVVDAVADAEVGGLVLLEG